MDDDSETRSVLDGLLETRLDQLQDLSEEELLTFIGCDAVTPTEYSSAVVYTYAPAELVTGLESKRLVVRVPVDLVLRGRRTVERVMADWGEHLRTSVCGMWKAKPRLRDLVIDIAHCLTGLLAVPASVVTAIGLYIARYLVNELCEGWEPAT